MYLTLYQDSMNLKYRKQYMLFQNNLYNLLDKEYMKVKEQILFSLINIQSLQFLLHNFDQLDHKHQYNYMEDQHIHYRK